ncbi:hypothetical protein B0T22DRAFT_186097 [Podospora appendiculata]|uniref:Secreted protein n=1 Tax=Podospora appendiculata TaxID=314037 RepID=A0AAE0XD12_9PEZI|nr:hypothetical protein B0T22DRAFT_186097 [Podospora appendiculata]
MTAAASHLLVLVVDFCGTLRFLALVGWDVSRVTLVHISNMPRFVPFSASSSHHGDSWDYNNCTENWSLMSSPQWDCVWAQFDGIHPRQPYSRRTCQTNPPSRSRFWLLQASSQDEPGQCHPGELGDTEAPRIWQLRLA